MMNSNPLKNKPFPWYLVLVACMAVAGIFFRLQANSASANSGDIQLAENTYPNIVGSRIDTCVLCHTSSIPNLNPFGAAYKAQGRGLASSLHAIEGADSDGDGFTNLQEILALTFPGNPADKPAAATATSTPFQPATATATRTQAPTNPAASATATQTSTATTAGASATPSKTATVTAVVPSATAGVRASRTPTAKPTLRSSVVPTCVSSKDNDDKDDDDHRANLNCSHRPNKGDSDDKGQNQHGSDDQDEGSSHRSSTADDRLSSVSSFLNNLFARLAGGSR